MLTKLTKSLYPKRELILYREEINISYFLTSFSVARITSSAPLVTAMRSALVISSKYLTTSFGVIFLYFSTQKVHQIIMVLQSKVF